MLNIIDYKIDLSKSELKYDKPFAKSVLDTDWVKKGGQWTVENGYLIGKSAPDSGGMIFSKKEYKHDIVMEFTASNIPPSTHDIDFMWHATWDDKKQIRDSGYVVGLNGWWENKIGFEKAPDNVLYASTKAIEIDPSKEYKIQAGTVKGVCFLFINNQLVIEMRDPNPIDYNKSPLLGFETYQSIIKIKDLKIYNPHVTKKSLSYNEEF